MAGLLLLGFVLLITYISGLSGFPLVPVGPDKRGCTVFHCHLRY